jgi:glycogen synthase kinase 3 beta
MEFMPTTVCRYVGKMKSFKRIIPPILIKVMMYQLFRSLAYIHEQTICHRDVKPENILFNPESGVLKLGDLGSAKKLVKGEHNVSYICSRYCRPPELLFGCSDYTTKVDIWSAGCVFAQILIGRPLFAASTNVDQLVEVIKVLGTPSKKHIEELNRKYLKFDFPNIDPVPLHSAFGPGTPEDAIHLLSQLLDFSPSARLHPMVACSHQFFDKLREKGTKLANGSDLPPLFNFTSSEKKIQERLKIQLDPALYV